MIIELNKLTSENKEWIIDFVCDDPSTDDKSEYKLIANDFINYLINKNIKTINTNNSDDLDILSDSFNDFATTQQEFWYDEGL